MTDEPFSPVQMAQLRLAMKETVEEAFADAGLRVDEGDNQDEARRDFMFLRAWRRGVNGGAAKIGWFVIIALMGGLWWLIQMGLSVWNKGG